MTIYVILTGYDYEGYNQPARAFATREEAIAAIEASGVWEQEPGGWTKRKQFKYQVATDNMYCGDFLQIYEMKLS